MMNVKVMNMSKKINFARILEEDVVPLVVNHETTPIHIVNVVANVELLLPGETLCLETICVNLSGVCKYEPRRFAAAIMHIKDEISTTTCLVYRQGKLVVVSARSRYHSLYACQIFRQLLESVKCVYREDGRLGLYDLKGRTKFYRWNIQNIVAHANLGIRPDLQILSEMGGEASTWVPQLFPACIILIWLKPKSECRCVNKKKKNASCKCTCRALIFDTGKMVLAGCKSIAGMNKAFELIKMLFEDDQLHDKAAEPSKSQRFQARRQKIMDACLESVEWKRNRTKVVAICDDITIENLLSMLPTKKQKRGREIPKEFPEEEEEQSDNVIEEAFVRAAVWGQVLNVHHMASYDTRYVEKALQCVDNSEMRQLLLQYK